jgi:hypothetical protein
MKSTTTIRSATGLERALSRTAAATLLRYERRHGKVLKIREGYILGKIVQVFIACLKPAPPPPRFEPRQFSLRARITHTYVPGWNDLDKWHDLGVATLARVKPARWAENGESYRQLEIVRVDSPGYRPRNIMRAIEDTMQSGCRCEHDCCGHIQTYVKRVRQLCPGTFAVLVGGYRNI